MSNDERPESLASQAAAWVPPWERPPREPDRAYQAAAEQEAREAAGETAPVDEPTADELDDAEEPDQELAGGAPQEAVAADGPVAVDGVERDDDAPVGVDSPVGDVPVGEPTDVRAGPELPLPDAVEQAVGDVGEADDGGAPVDAPLPPDGDDAGDVFDTAADDDVSDDAELDLPFAGEVPDYGVASDADEATGSASDADEATALAPDDDEATGPASDADEATALAPDADEATASDVATDGDRATTDGDTATTDAGAADGGAADGGAADGGAADGGAGDGGVPVDAPLPPDGDDAGGVFDAAADDDVSDDGEVDLPFTGEVPAYEEVPGDDGVPVDGGVLAGGGSAEDGPGAVPGRERGGAEARAAVPGQSRGAGSGRGAVVEATSRTSEVFDLPVLVDEAELAAALEAILLVVDEPVAEMQLAQIMEQPTERIASALEDISARYTAAGHGFDLRRAAGGWRLYTRPEYAAYVERFVLDGQSVRLTQAALETLAVVAYKQPVTRSRISAIRGVNCDGVMRTLVTRGLIEECGTEGETGAYLYRTTPLFLEKLGLNSVDQLPPLAPFLPDDVEEVLDASG